MADDVRVSKRTRTAVLSHWARLIEELQASPQDFYDRIEAALDERQIPDIEVSRVDWHEGGPLSSKREYLRLTRERMVFDICGAPFGSGFFVSNRFSEIPLQVAWIRLLIVFVLVTYLLNYVLGLIWGIIVLMGIVLAVVVLMRQALARGFANVDRAILKDSLIGPLYERYLRRITYYRIDTALMYQQAVQAALMQVIDELIKDQGIQPLSESERKPVLRELYKH